jgi:DNA-binding NtrC family response regulator
MEALTARILIVDDEPIVRESLAAFLRERDYNVDLAAGGEEAIALASENRYHLVILDIRMPGVDGLATLHELKARQPDLPVLMMTAYADVTSAVAAMKSGAYDYLVKPFDPDEVCLIVRNVVAHQNLVRENLALRSKLEERERFEEIIGRSPRMRAVFEMIAAVADTNVTVLIGGESGTGKELAARAVHRRSLRAAGAFVVVTCGGLPEALVESELFGHERGAFTGAVARRKGRFEVAQGGTLLLDEIADISPKTQLDLLRVVETKRFTRLGGTEELTADVRILAATNRDLAEEVRAGRFREDLFYRLNVVSIRLPALRERREDIPLLAHHFLHHYARQMGRAAKAFSPAAMQLLLAHEWPGNVRELANAVERAVAVGRTDEVQPADLPIGALGGEPATGEAGGRTLVDVERRHIETTLQEHDWNVSRSAAALGIDRVTLYKKMKRFGLKRPGDPDPPRSGAPAR